MIQKYSEIWSTHRSFTIIITIIYANVYIKFIIYTVLHMRYQFASLFVFVVSLIFNFGLTTHNIHESFLSSSVYVFELISRICNQRFICIGLEYWNGFLFHYVKKIWMWFVRRMTSNQWWTLLLSTMKSVAWNLSECLWQ